MVCNRGSKILFFWVLLCFVLSFILPVQGQNIWPMPKTVSSGFNTLYLSNNFELRTSRSNYSDNSGILKEAFERMVQLIKAGHTPKADFPDSRVHDGVGVVLHTFDVAQSSRPVLAGIYISVRSPNETLNFGIDESYYLYVPDKGSILFARIEAATVFGALHALEVTC